MKNEHNALRNLKFNEAAAFCGISPEANKEFDIDYQLGKAKQYEDIFKETGIPFYEDAAQAHKRNAFLLQHPELKDTVIQQNLS